MSRHQETMRRLRSLSEKGATEGERRAAQRAYDRMVELFGEEPEDEVQESDIIIRYKHWEEELLLQSIGWYLGLEVLSLSTVRKLKRVVWRGDSRLFKVGRQLYNDTVDDYVRRVRMFALGLSSVMFPRPPSEDDDAPAREFSREEIEAFFAGSSQNVERSGRAELNETNTKASLDK